jgi:type V secretory pathway adhesin AidA
MRMRANVCLWAVALVLGAGVPALAADVAGTWKWSVERNGQTFETTLKLMQDGEKLTGQVINVRDGNETKTDIEDGKISGDTVTFKVTREFNGNKVVISYEGKVSGDTIKGESSRERDGQTMKREWEAKKAS